MWVMWWVHAGAVHWLHWHWCIVVEAIVVLHWRLVMWVVTGIIVPCGAVVIKMILVMMLFVVHLQLAHGE
jgi:hypothetical protein